MSELTDREDFTTNTVVWPRMLKEVRNLQKGLKLDISDTIQTVNFYSKESVYKDNFTNVVGEKRIGVVFMSSYVGELEYE